MLMSHDQLIRIPYFKSLFSYGGIIDANLGFDDITVKHVMTWVKTGIIDYIHNHDEFLCLIDYLCLQRQYVDYVTKRMLRVLPVCVDEEITSLIDPLIVAYYANKYNQIK